jgi:hypothetical protein
MAVLAFAGWLPSYMLRYPSLNNGAKALASVLTELCESCVFLATVINP